jgi:hypothetical protein
MWTSDIVIQAKPNRNSAKTDTKYKPPWFHWESNYSSAFFQAASIVWDPVPIGIVGRTCLTNARKRSRVSGAMIPCPINIFNAVLHQYRHPLRIDSDKVRTVPGRCSCSQRSLATCLGNGKRGALRTSHQSESSSHMQRECSSHCGNCSKEIYKTAGSV